MKNIWTVYNSKCSITLSILQKNEKINQNNYKSRLDLVTLDFCSGMVKIDVLFSYMYIFIIIYCCLVSVKVLKVPSKGLTLALIEDKTGSIQI